MGKKKSKDENLVTRIYQLTVEPNTGKNRDFTNQALELERLRKYLWGRFASFGTDTSSIYNVRNMLMSEGLNKYYSVQQRVWRAAVEDTLGDINAFKQATISTSNTKKILRDNFKKKDPDRYKELCKLLKSGKWLDDSYLSWLVRRQTHHVLPRKDNTPRLRITFDNSSYDVHIDDQGRTWLAVMSQKARKRIKICAGVLPDGMTVTTTIQLIYGDYGWELHIPVDEKLVSSMRISHSKKHDSLGLDAGVREAFVDSEGNRYLPELGDRLEQQTERSKERNTRKAKLRFIRNEHNRKAALARKKGDKKTAKHHQSKADKITENNLGDKKLKDQKRKRQAQTRDMYFRAMYEVFEKTDHVFAEDLTNFKPQKDKRSRKQNRKSSTWARSVLKEAIKTCARRRGSTATFANPAYSSQQLFVCKHLGVRSGTTVYCSNEDCPHAGVLYDSEVNAALNIQERGSENKIPLWWYPSKVKEFLLSEVEEFCPSEERVKLSTIALSL